MRAGHVGYLRRAARRSRFSLRTRSLSHKGDLQAGHCFGRVSVRRSQRCEQRPHCNINSVNAMQFYYRISILNAVLL